MSAGSRARTARRIAIAAAYGGGGLGALAGSTVALLWAEAKLARRQIGEPTEAAPDAERTYGADHPGAPLALVLLGDSGAAGIGVATPAETPGAHLAGGLAEVAERPVRLRVTARSGARSADLDAQIDTALSATTLPTEAVPHRPGDPQAGPAHRPDVAVIMIGTNDVTHRVPAATSLRHLEAAVRRLRAAGAEVVVGTCPDLGTVEPIAQPLRTIARRASRQLAAGQTIAVVEAGGRTVSLGDLLGPEFAAAAGTMFGPDRFHPSPEGYAAAAAALLPAVAGALGYWPEEAGDAVAGPAIPVAVAAAAAAASPGSEVAGAHRGGAERGPQGRWARLRPRRRRTAAPGLATETSTPSNPSAAALPGARAEA